MSPAGWTLVALAPTIPALMAWSYIKGRNEGRNAQADDPVGRLSVWLYQVLHANPVKTVVYLEATRPTEDSYSLGVLNADLLETDVIGGGDGS
jgi:hypothetical protein